MSVPSDPSQGQPRGDEQAELAARESAEAMAQQDAQQFAEAGEFTSEEALAADAEEAAAAEAEAEEAEAHPMAEGTAAAQTGIDKQAAAFSGSPEPDAGDAPRDPTVPQRQRDRPRTQRGEDVLVRAQAKYVRTSARKARLVCDHIRGKDVDEARAILAFTPRAAAKPWSKLLESAIANAEHNHELVGDELRIDSVHADEGPTLKRFQPRAMGRASRIRKRTSHLTIVLTPKE